MRWHKQFNDQDTHPDIIPVGFAGATVFRCLCRINGTREFGGAIPLKYASPDYLVGLLKMVGDVPDPVKFVETGLSRCIEQGLLVEVDGCLDIPGARRMLPDPTGADRQKRHRDTKKAEPTVTTVTVTDSDAPLRNDGNARGEESRREESREENHRESVRPRKREPSPAPKSVVEHVRKTTGRPWRSPHSHLTARLKAGATPEECILVAECKHDEWGGDEKMDQYVRQKTLYARSNFEDYLTQAVRWDEGGRKPQRKGAKPIPGSSDDPFAEYRGTGQ